MDNQCGVIHSLPPLPGLPWKWESSSDLIVRGAVGELELTEFSEGDSSSGGEQTLLSFVTMPASNHCRLKFVRQPSMMT